LQRSEIKSPAVFPTSIYQARYEFCSVRLFLPADELKIRVFGIGQLMSFGVIYGTLNLHPREF